MDIGVFWGSGIIALISLLFIIVSFIVEATKQLFINKKTVDEHITILYSIVLASIAYCVQALFNDSIIGSGIIFWILMGIGVSIQFRSIESKN